MTATKVHNWDIDGVERSKTEERVLTLMKKELDMLSEVLRVTEITQLSGDEGRVDAEAPEYSFLIEKREKMFDTIKSAERRIKALLEGHEPSIRLSAETERMTADRDMRVRRILELDKANYSKSREIQKNLKTKIKNINMGINAQLKYQSGLDMAVSLNAEA